MTREQHAINILALTVTAVDKLAQRVYSGPIDHERNELLLVLREIGIAVDAAKDVLEAEL